MKRIQAFLTDGNMLNTKPWNLILGAFGLQAADKGKRKLSDSLPEPLEAKRQKPGNSPATASPKLPSPPKPDNADLPEEPNSPPQDEDLGTQG